MNKIKHPSRKEAIKVGSKKNNFWSTALSLIVLFLWLPWFANLGLVLVPASDKSLASFVGLGSDSVLISGLLTFVFTSIVWITAIVVMKIRWGGEIHAPLVSNRKIFIVSKLILTGLSILVFYFILAAFERGLILTVIEYRFNDREIGFLGYSALLFMPYVLGVTWATNKTITNLSLLVIFAIFNLLTGFRLLLFFGLAIILFLNLEKARSLPVKKILVILSLIGLIFVSYAAIRASAEAAFSGSGSPQYAVLEGFARSLPIHYFALVEEKAVSFEFNVLASIMVEPLTTIISKLLFLDIQGQSAATAVSEALVRDYLIWRGTPAVEATGFSINIIPLAYMFGGIYGVLGFGVLTGVYAGLGLRCLQSSFYVERLFGSALLLFVLGVSEAFSVAWSVMFNGLLFLCFLSCLSRVLGWVRLFFDSSHERGGDNCKDLQR